jgi:hypothetical protein
VVAGADVVVGYGDIVVDGVGVGPSVGAGVVTGAGVVVGRVDGPIAQAKTEYPRQQLIPARLISIPNSSATPPGPEYANVNAEPIVEYFFPPGTLLFEHTADQETGHVLVSGYSGHDALLIALASSQIELKIVLSVIFVVIESLLVDGTLTVIS